MDSTQRISERGRPVYLTSKQPKVNQTTEAIVSVSEDRSVSKEQREKVGGVSADRKASLNRYKELLEGKTLPAMTQLMGADKAEEPAARKALEKPSLDKDMTQPADKDEDAVGKVDSESSKKATEGSQKPKEKGVDGEELSQEESKEVQNLKNRDREVRTHEQAHVAAGGQHIRGGIKYDYQRGPDGRTYAVGGHVNIDVSEAESPEATVTKMQQVKRAALAPAEPSGADRAVAAAASQKEQQARTEILENRQKDMAKRREKVDKTGSEVRESGESTSSESSSSQVSAQSSDAPSTSAEPIVPESQAPEARTHMNLARDSRMRIKRGISWRA
ncbi:MAG: hypothetical protein CMH49_02245 [Myxococcales bacterium]|nr:hypothetical protein [Myxococcales bacterium]